MGHSGTAGSNHVAIETLWDKPLVPETGGQATLLVRLTANPAALPPLALRSAVNVAFALDCSGSMSGEKIKLAKQAAMTAVERLREKDWAALVAFDTDVHRLFPLAPMTREGKKALKAAIARLEATSSTNLSGGWLEASQELARAMAGDVNKGRVRRTMLLTDGQANAGIVNPYELAVHASALRQRGIGTTTIGLGAGFDELLLTSMAEAGGGNFQFIEHPSQMPAFFDRELEEMLSVVAPALSLSLRFPPGAQVDLVNPFPVDRADGRFIVSIGDLAATSETSLIFMVDLPPAPNGAAHEGSVNARWFDRATMANANRRQEIEPLRWVPRAEAEASRTDPIVAEHAAVQRVYVEEREAMRLDREGRRLESRQRLGEASKLLAAAPSSARVNALRQEVACLQEVDVNYDEMTLKRVQSDAFRRARKHDS